MNAKQINKQNPRTSRQHASFLTASVPYGQLQQCSGSEALLLLIKYLTIYRNVTFIFPKRYGIIITSQALGHYRKLEMRQ